MERAVSIDWQMERTVSIDWQRERGVRDLSAQYKLAGGGGCQYRLAVERAVNTV
jgi:hypothetical protein